MRGSPFGFSDFSRGLNTLDSPYTLQNGEARKCLNVVASPRGAIKKRNGSTLFANALSSYFPESVVDTFVRADESPLSNGGKWEAITVNDNTGEVKGNAWRSRAVSIRTGALWNLTKSTNQAAAVQFKHIPVFAAPFSLFIYAEKKRFLSGYSLEVVPTAESSTLFTLKLWAHKSSSESGGESSMIAKVEKVTIENGDYVGIGERGGVLSAWIKKGSGAWTKLMEGSTTVGGFPTYTEGYAGMHYPNITSELEVSNFSLGTMPAVGEITSAFTTLASVTIGGVPYLIGAAGKNLYSFNAAGEGSIIKEGMTEGKRWSVFQAETGTRVTGGPVYMSNGTDPPQYWSGAAKNTETKAWTGNEEAGNYVEVPKAKYLVFFANRVWAAGVASDPAALRWTGFQVVAGEGSKPDPTQWPKGNIEWFDKEDGNELTGLGVAGPNLIVFKKHKSWVVYDLNEGENRRLSDSVGCVSHRTIVETPQGTFFLTPDQGVFSTNGSTLREVSRNVRSILQGSDTDITRAAKLNKLEEASAGFLNGHYYLSYVAQDGTQKTLDYDVTLQSWWLHDLAGNQWVLWEPVTGEPYLYTIPNKAKAGVVRAFYPNIYTDSGANYTGNAELGLGAFWVSHWEPFFQYVLRHRINQPQVKKRVKELFVDGKGEVVSFVYKSFKGAAETLLGVVDNADESVPTSPVTLGKESQETQAARYYSLGVGRVWSVGFGNNSAQPFEIDSYALDLQFRKS